MGRIHPGFDMINQILLFGGPKETDSAVEWRLCVVEVGLVPMAKDSSPLFHVAALQTFISPSTTSLLCHVDWNGHGSEEDKRTKV